MHGQEDSITTCAQNWGGVSQSGHRGLGAPLPLLDLEQTPPLASVPPGQRKGLGRCPSTEALPTLTFCSSP